MKKSGFSRVLALGSAFALLVFCLAPSCLAQAAGLPSASPGARGRARTGELARRDEQVEAMQVGHLTGQISPDGKTLTQEKTRTRWVITDPALVRAYKDKYVSVKAHIDAPQHAISVVKVRPANRRVNPHPSQQ